MRSIARNATAPGRLSASARAWSDLLEGRNAALDGDLCKCKCDPPPRLIANQTLRCQEIDGGSVAPRCPSRRSTCRAGRSPPTRSPSRAPPVSRLHRAAHSELSAELPGLVCQNLWRGYQQRAEAVVAPGGVLIADPKARNRAINAAYAQLWLRRSAFPMGGPRGFRLQAGRLWLCCMPPIRSRRFRRNIEARQQLKDSARKKFSGLFSRSEREQAGENSRDFEQAQRDYEQARRNNPRAGHRPRGDDESLSYAQTDCTSSCTRCWRMGNTTLFLDVFPLHAFYKERGLQALEDLPGFTAKTSMGMVSIRCCGRSSRKN